MKEFFGAFFLYICLAILLEPKGFWQMFACTVLALALVKTSLKG